MDQIWVLILNHPVIYMLLFMSDQALKNLTPEERAQLQASRGNFRNYGRGVAMNKGGFGHGRGMGAAGFNACPRW